jgi:hypothetical protein
VKNTAAGKKDGILTNCPVCDEPGLKRTVHKSVVEDPFGGQVEIDKVYYSCDQCGAEGDWNNENEVRYLAALETLQKMAVSNIAESLKNDHGISNLYLERCFALPMRTVARWKKDGASAAATALMKCVATYPWLVELGEKNFDSVFANELLIKNAESAKCVPNTGLVIPEIEANGIKKVGTGLRYAAADEELALAA